MRHNDLLTPPLRAEESIRAQTKIDSPSNDHILAVPIRQTNDSTSSQVAYGQTSPKSPVHLRRLSLACLLVAPLIAIPPLTRVLVDHVAPLLAHVATSTLDRAFAWRPIHSPQDTPVTPDIAPPAFAEPPTTLENESQERSGRAGATRAKGIVVRANAVVHAVRRGGRPSSVPAPASGQRPAGLSLLGVSHYGTGLRDGDILTQVGGTSATSEGVVIGIVAGAISQGAKVITGVVWRGEQRLDVAVEIPGPEAFRATPRSNSARQ
ncbi:MAG TPA: hypothetical protein PKA58_04935 [Polyangium sp.]|nr:hypothetical protein [Polyangium sp.]